MNELSSKKASDLLNTLRKELDLKRKDKEKNGVILIKEPIKTKDKSAPLQPYRTLEGLKRLVEKEFSIKYEETIAPRKTCDKDKPTYFPKQAVFVGQWDHLSCYHNN